MFQQAFGIFSCQNPYNCIETFILALLSACTLWLFARAYVLIRQDKAQILDNTDKIIFTLASVHNGLLTLIFIIFTSPFFLYTVRTLYLTLDIVICSVVAYMYFSRESHSKVNNVTRLALLWALLLWFYSVLMPESIDTENECKLFNIMLFSLTSITVSAVLLFCGYGSIRIINDVNDMERKQSVDEEYNLWQVRRFQELKERKIQITTLTIVNAIAPTVQLIWDITKYDPTSTAEQCFSLSFAQNVGDIFVFTIIKILCNLLPSWGIYYLYYWRNREHFRTNNANYNRYLNDFEEFRSDMIELV